MPQNDAILRQLRAIVDAGGPQIPSRSHLDAPGTISRPSGLETPQPMSDEPLAAGNGFMDLLNRTPLGLLMDFNNPLEAASPPLGRVPKRIRGFRLPDGKIALPDVEGVHQIVDESPHFNKPGYIRTNTESGFAPSVTDPSHLSDVSVPIADSLDTAATPKLPLVGKHSAQQSDPLKRRTTSVTRDDILTIRDLYSRGWTPADIKAYKFQHLSDGTVTEIARRLSFAKVE